MTYAALFERENHFLCLGSFVCSVKVSDSLIRGGPTALRQTRRKAAKSSYENYVLMSLKNLLKAKQQQLRMPLMERT